MSRTFLVPLLALAACDSQVDGDHQGQALAQLSGTVQNARTQPTADAEVAVVWNNSSGSPDLIGGDTADVEGNFPAAFRLSIYEPPADALINDFGDSRVGVAYIISATAGTDYGNEQELETNALGLDQNHLLVYLPEDVVPGTLASILLRGTPAAGFHIYDVGHLSDADMASRQACVDGLGQTATEQQIYDTCGGSPVFDDFLPAPADLDTPLQVDLVDDLDQLDPPNWT